MPVIHRSQQAGFTLIEVLVAALVLAIGILGLATTMLLGLKSDQGAYFRSQASAIAYDMADRIRLNRGAAASYVGIDTNSAIPANPNCSSSSGGCSSSQQLALDIREWAWNFGKADNFTTKLPNGRGEVTRDADGRFLITISWSEADTGNRANQAQSLIIRMTL